MRVNVNETPRAYAYRALLNGVSIPTVFEADDEAGSIAAGALIVVRHEGAVTIEPPPERGE